MNEKIIEIQKKIEEEGLQKEKRQKDIKKNFRAVLISCTTSEHELGGSTVQFNLPRNAVSADFTSE